MPPSRHPIEGRRYQRAMKPTALKADLRALFGQHSDKLGRLRLGGANGLGTGCEQQRDMMTTPRPLPLLAVAAVTLATACNPPCETTTDCGDTEMCVVEAAQTDGYCAAPAEPMTREDEGGEDTNPENSHYTSNRAQFTFDCDLGGAVGQLTVNIEAINQAGSIWGSGPNPQIKAVVGLGSVLYVTSGELRSQVAAYSFTGENQYADFTDLQTYDRFRVRWILNGQTLVMVINPFGGATQHTCQQTSARYL